MRDLPPAPRLRPEGLRAVGRCPGGACPLTITARSAHFTFPKTIKYKDLAKVWPEFFQEFLELTKQVPEELEFSAMILNQDMAALRSNRKPEGFNRQGKVRLVFPITRGQVKFYLYRNTRSEEIPRVAEQLTKVFAKSKAKPKLNPKLSWDEMVLYRLKDAKLKK